MLQQEALKWVATGAELMTLPLNISMFMLATGKKLLMECGAQVNLMVLMIDVLLVILLLHLILEAGMMRIAATILNLSVK